MKLAILKGNRLNEWHLAMYEQALEAVSPDFPLEISAFTTPDNLFDTEELSINIVRVPYEYEAGPWWNRLLARWKYWKEHESTGYEFAPYNLEHLLKGFDLIQSWEMFTTHSRAAVRATEKSGAKSLITVWDDIPFNFEDKPFKAGIKKEVRAKADGFLAYTEAAIQSLKEEGIPAERIHRIWPSLDLSRFEGQRQQPAEFDPEWAEGTPFFVLYAGRFVREKGIFDLLDAMEPLFRKHHERKLMLLYIGSGREMEMLMQQVRQKNLTDRVKIIRRQHYKAMPEWIRMADLIVLPSRPRPDWREQFGMIAIEGLAAGRPVIASRTPGTGEILGESALFIESGAVEQLRQSIEYVIKSPDEMKSRSEKGRQWAREKFDQRKNAPQLLDIYRQVLKNQ
jgi:alpha-maltose-1-phosphate synthase